LPFTLLSDEHKTVIKMYGLAGPLGIGVRRASFLVDGGRRVRDAVSPISGFHVTSLSCTRPSRCARQLPCG